MYKHNLCSTLTRYRGFHSFLWSFVPQRAIINIPSRPSSSNGLVSSTFYKFRSFIRFILGETPNIFQYAVSNVSFETVRKISQPTLRSPFISRLITGQKIPLNEFYFQNASRFRKIKRKYLINTGFSFSLVIFYVCDDELFREMTNTREKRSTWQNAFNIVKNQFFQLNEIRDDINCVKKIQFGMPISKGCNGIVYHGQIQPKNEFETPEKIAVKMLFNYDTESNSEMILNSYIKETLPFQGKFGDVQIKRKTLSSHPNIVKILSVFTGEFQLLNDCTNLYPMAMPRKFGGFGRNMTLFIVEKLYDFSLKEYLELVPLPKKRNSVGMLAQLFDGINFLYQNHVAHRDLKPDNILVKLNNLESLPWLVIADFGLASTSLIIPFPMDDVIRGGNRALMAPEIINAKSGVGLFLNYNRSDIWAIGTIAYELFGAENPFYRRTTESKKIHSAMYDESCLPAFPSNCRLLSTFIRKILSIDPSERPSPSFASTFCHLLLYMGAKNLFRFARLSNEKIRISLIESWWRTFMNNLIFQTWNMNGEKNEIYEHQLQINFVSNITFKQLISDIKECQFYA